MSNREDYLDSLLKSVTDEQEEPTFFGTDNEFLKEFEEEFQNLDTDSFLKDFENELQDMPELDEMPELDADDVMVDNLDMGKASDMEAPQGFEGLEDIFQMLDSSTETTEAEEKETMERTETEEPQQPTENQEEEVVDDAELMEILSGLSSDEDLADIGNMLKAHDEDTLLPEDNFDGFIDELEPLKSEDVQDAQKGKKKKKVKNEQKGEKVGLLKKISKALFGEEEEVIVPESGELGSISSENMDILKELDKKEEKKKKKKEKKEQKELNKKAKKEQKAQKKESKPKKEKKPKPPAEKSKPLPKLPVFLIFLMVGSLVLLVFLASTLVGYNNGMKEARSEYDKGYYVHAYEKMRGMKIKEADMEFYDKARVLAYMQQELDAFKGYINKEMYPEALDALITAVGKYDKFYGEATVLQITEEYDKMLGMTEQVLTEVYRVTVEEAREVYGQVDRESYTKKMYELLQRAGYTE